ncbi:hypothetical protein FB45DRAFT_230815 [Roridomyces roridus]|uniref:MYND-type domain-containing protein n=1 Tax=Roridomyces roridus TaxID=1738132 RepID=A0AAD7BBS5_9AGAR|nr:hypothetical protein FB45DRAFT_230815 [Roridomyces roridus]
MPRRKKVAPPVPTQDTELVRLSGQDWNAPHPAAHSPPPRPNKHTDRVAWNEWYERELKLRYTRLVDTPPMDERFEAEMDETIVELNLSIARTTKPLMRAEGLLIALALENLKYGRFEDDWKAMGVKKRRGLVLEGLYRGACSCPRENSRALCPELRIEVLLGDGEFGLIDLLKKIIAHDPTGNLRVKTPFLYEHPYIAHEYRCSENASPSLKAFAHRCLLLRTFCIVQTLTGILEAFNNHPLPPIISVDEDEDEISTCNTCEKEMDIQDVKLCSQCQITSYCSAACQKKDWSDHKKFCGKQDFDPDLTPSPEAPPSFIGCPPVVDGYVRTPSLWRQIEWLGTREAQDSLYRFDTKPGQTIKMVVPDPAFALEFLVARRRAMMSGDVSAVHMMYAFGAFTHGYGSNSELTVEQIVRQLQKDFNVEIKSESMEGGIPERPTDRERKEEADFFRRRLSSAGLGIFRVSAA